MLQECNKKTGILVFGRNKHKFSISRLVDFNKSLILDRDILKMMKRSISSIINLLEGEII